MLYQTQSKGTSIGAWLLALSVLLLVGNPINAAIVPSEYDMNQPIYGFDFLSFKNSPEGGETLLEIFCSIPTDFQFVKFDGGFFASYELRITLYDASNNEVAGTAFVDSVKVKTFGEIDLTRPPHLVRAAFLVNPGYYTAKITLKDLETRREGEFEKKIGVPDYHVSKLMFSDLQIANMIKPAGEEARLVKNGRTVVPNVYGIVDPKTPVLYVYSELYNLRYKRDGANKRVLIGYSILNKEGDEVRRNLRQYQKPGNTCVLSFRISVADLQAGMYKLHVSARDLDSEQTAHRSTYFYIATPEENVYSEAPFRDLPRHN